MIKIRLIALFLISLSLVDVASAGWASAIGELLGKASGKAVKVVDDVPIPKHSPDVAPVTKPNFEPVPATEANFNASAQVARVVAKCKEQKESADWQKQCERKGDAMMLCIDSESKKMASKEKMLEKCKYP
jgi:hypothetical protein